MKQKICLGKPVFIAEFLEGGIEYVACEFSCSDFRIRRVISHPLVLHIVTNANSLINPHDCILLILICS